MATYVNNLRLKEITTGDESGTWGTSTNTNLELIADAFGSGTEAITTNADTHTTTVADGAADEGRAIYMKYTGTLDSACTITLAPNTINKFWIIENATSGSQNIIISQGSGANITIGNGNVSAIFTDGAGGGAAVLDALADLELSAKLTVAGASTLTGAVTASGGITSTASSNSFGATSFGDADITNVGDIALDTISADSSSIGIASPVTISGTTPTLTIGDAGAEDTKIVFDGAAQDFYVGLDDSADDLVIGLGSTVGTTPAITIDEDQKLVFPAAHVTVGDGTAEDTALIYNGNAQDFYIGLDDSADDLIIGLGSTVGSTAILSMTEDQHVSLQAAKRLYFDGFGNTYLAEPSSDVLMVTVGGTDRWKFSGGNFLSEADDNNDIGAAGATRPRDVYIGTTIQVGDNPSAYGDIRLKKDFIVATRNNANDANKVMFSENVMTGNDTMDIGDNTKWAAIRFHVSTLNVMELTSSAINLNKAVTANNAAFKLTGLVTSDPGVAGQLWNSSGDVKISAG